MTFTHLPAPAHCPKPDPAYPLNEGREIARVARLMGAHLQPWQRMTLNRATQYRWGINAQGEKVRAYKYSKVLVSVPRQSGKTFLTGPLQLHRLLLRPASETLFTAQTGADAGKRVRELIALVRKSPAGALVTPRFSNGSEGLTVIENGSTLTRFSPTLSSVHGGHPHLVVLDEIWKHSLALGEGLLGAISPSQVTIRQEAQIWMVSTKGTAKSEFMNTLIDQGVNGSDPSLCYIEFSMPEGADPYDPATWKLFHPALGNTLTAEALASDMGLPYGEWMRAYMNVVVASDNPLIALEDFDHLQGEPLAVPDLNDVTIAYEASGIGQCGAVVACWRDLDGVAALRVLKQAPGTAWLPAYVAGLMRTYPSIQVVADNGGPTRRITDEITERADVDPTRVRALTMTERLVADGNLLSAINETGSIKHDGSQALRLAVANAVGKESNDVQRFDRDRSTAPIPSLIAASVALWGCDHKEEAFWTLA